MRVCLNYHSSPNSLLKTRSKTFKMEFTFSAVLCDPNWSEKNSLYPIIWQPSHLQSLPLTSLYSSSIITITVRLCVNWHFCSLCLNWKLLIPETNKQHQKGLWWCNNCSKGTINACNDRTKTKPSDIHSITKVPSQKSISVLTSMSLVPFSCKNH